MSNAVIIDGNALAADLRRRIAAEVARLGLTPGLAVVLVGDDPASQVYVRNKLRMTAEVGMVSFENLLPAETGAQELLRLIADLNNDGKVNGILVQLPLPAHIGAEAVLNAIDPAKDVDGFHVINAGRLAAGIAEAMVPCTPQGCIMMLKAHLGNLSGLKALVLGRSNIVGKPMAALLLRENCTVTIAHSKTRDLAGECRQADILVAASGAARMVKGDWIKPGAVVIDVGIVRVPAPEKGEGKTRLVGDVDFEAALKTAGAITPVPGGVGPMTIACLLRNTLIAACRQHGLEDPNI
ncbi:MAG: bifunctional methylenetetrahydrofolate dehydrogenase/methenyltetrahydrofolate cyclohydrolase [Rhodospirillales bacterium RIFCSPLOWO2_12_FULL_58_28]|nr:MAG: bifunctional methylenetetrahydrofolate dehydrogenase/methenyltetrahydrofolate cyclohydrolase [Rhodospirillales bacterium RIFCSPLOWO2_02_FULL_58_16]OHC77080.1 MAG: bifunctional methylenetetrahydrofolate dehydrogenase/methenyltetrahydrofolate cyclohydrolase [Rhodospirillales bacterium RIFCSPLOWO2_12_FULL_58_28]